MNNILSRRTIRRYSSRDVDANLLHRLLHQAARTQTMGNLQLYSVIETRSHDGKARLATAHFNQPMVTTAPVVLTVCADFRRTTTWANCRNAHPGYDNILSFLNAATDALLYTQTFCNLAEEAGLGLCFLGTTLYQPETIIQALALPQLVFPVATLTVGWPDEQPPLTDRLPLQSFLHAEHYADPTPDDIDRFYANKEAMPQNQEFVRINNTQTLAQIFTDIRYTRRDNETISHRLIHALRRQRFLSQ